MANPKMVKKWMAKSKKDLMAAKYLRDAKEDFNEIAAYHCQQSIEKTLKAYLVYLNIRPQKIHDIEELLQDTEGKFDSYFEKIAATRVTEFSINFRYPDAEVTALIPEELDEAIVVANELFLVISKIFAS